MPLTIPGVSNTIRRPGYFFGIAVGGAGTGSGSATPNLLLAGNMIATALTGASPSFTTAAGTRQTSGTADETPIQCYSTDEVATYFGRGSELHRMALMVALVDPSFDSFNLWCIPIAEASNTKASATITFVGNATSSGTIVLVIAGTRIEVGVTSGDTVTTIATNIATEIVTKYPDLPVTAQFLAGVLTVTAKNGGPRGNDIAFRAYWLNGTNLIKIGTSTTQFGTAATITGSGRLASGATGDSPTNALTAISSRQYHRMAWPFPSTDSTNINLVRDHMISQSAATVMRFEQAVFGSISSPSTVVTYAGSILSELCQLAHAENSDHKPASIAAAVAAARLAGDARFTSAAIPGESSDPAANLNALQLPIPLPELQTDEPTVTEIETMVKAGVSPLAPSSMRPGYMELVTSLNTRFKDSAGNIDYSAVKTKVPTVLQDVATKIAADFAVTYRGYKLAPDSKDNAPVDQPRVVTPSIARDRIKAMLTDMQNNLAEIVNVAALDKELIVQINPSNKNRLDINIPVEPIADLDIAAGVVRQRSA